MPTPLIIRPAAGDRGGFVAALGVHGRTRHVPGRWESEGAARAAALACLPETEEPGLAHVLPARGNAGDLTRCWTIAERADVLGTALPMPGHLMGHAWGLTVPWEAQNRLLDLRGDRPRLTSTAAPALGRLGIERWPSGEPVPAGGWIYTSLPGDPHTCRLTDRGEILAEIVAGLPAGEGWPRRLVVCGGWHRRSPGAVHRVHRDCPWCGGVAFALAGQPERERPRVCDAGGACSPPCGWPPASTGALESDRAPA